MLFTRCPHCNTTFRITAEALGKAEGQVRCGRCVNIFNAYAELREKGSEGSTAATGGAEAASRTEAASPDRADEATSAAPGADEAPIAAPASPEAAPPPEAPRKEPSAELDVSADAALDDEVVAAAPVDEATAGDDARVDADEASPPRSPSTWLPYDGDSASGPPHARLWSVAAGLAVLALLAQITHHFRNEFASQPLIGPVVHSAYAFLGTPVMPRWDIEQYRILDWVATAEPNPSGRGDLAISARIQNRGPDPQPFPHVLVQLKDRWESTIGSRVFAPSEYLANTSHAALMAPGDTANAELILIDPGPDAYGFEIDVCVEYGAEQLHCATDRVFR